MRAIKYFPVGRNWIDIVLISGDKVDMRLPFVLNSSILFIGRLSSFNMYRVVDAGLGEMDILIIGCS